MSSSRNRRTSAAEQYFADICAGRMRACRKMRRLAEKMLKQIRKGYKQWHFDIEAAERPVYFIENFCCQPAGRLGEKLVLEPFERAIIETAFGFVDDRGKRRFREVLVIIGRKNGKSTLLAALMLYMLIGDREGAPQVYSAANSEKQAELCFKAAHSMLKQSADLKRRARKRTGDIYCDFNLGTIATLSSQTDNLDGLDVHLGVIDEIHAAKSREAYDLVIQGMSAREQPMLVCITTNGFVRNSIFDSQYDYASRWLEDDIEDDTFLAFIYELDEREEWTDEDMWVKANPGLGTIKKADALRANVEKAKNDPSFRQTVMTKDFNMPENQSVAWLNYEESVNEEEFEPKGFRYGILGFDAAETVDLTAAQVLMMRPGDDRIYEMSMYWMPEEEMARVLSGERNDNVPYAQWMARGLLRTVEGNKVDKRVVLEWLDELKEKHDIYTYAAGFDPWHIDDTLRRELKQYVGTGRSFPIRQGAPTLSQPMKQIRADYRANRIVDNHNPINEWCRMNVMVKVDSNNNLTPDKKAGDPRNRIDGFMAEIIAYTVLCNIMDEYQQAI